MEHAECNLGSLCGDVSDAKADNRVCSLDDDSVTSCEVVSAEVSDEIVELDSMSCPVES